jgi:cytidylate kinase
MMDFHPAGKSTMAKDRAKERGYTYIDTGAMYRAVTLYCLNEVFANDQISCAFEKRNRKSVIHFRNNAKREKENYERRQR